jgi:DNA polymerase III, alpha subunit (gram-positive type)
LLKEEKLSKTVMEYLEINNVVSHLPDENQLSLFDFLRSENATVF